MAPSWIEGKADEQRRSKWVGKKRRSQKKEGISLERSEIVWFYDSRGLETQGKAAGFGAS